MSVYPEGLEILVLTFVDRGHDSFFSLVVVVVVVVVVFFSSEVLHFPQHQLDMVLLDLAAHFQI